MVAVSQIQSIKQKGAHKLMQVERDTILAEQIVQSILEDVKAGRLKPGDKLPSEKQMLAIYQVSRGPVREALRTLRIMNVIDIKQGKGAFVTTLDSGLLLEHLEFVLDLDKSTVFHLFEARRILEPEITYLATLRASDEEINQLWAVAMQGFQADILIHEMIAKATRNPVLLRYITSITYLGEMSREQTSAVPGVKEAAHEQHLKLIDAMAMRDPELARTRMKEHLDFVINSYRNYLSSTNPSASADAATGASAQPVAAS